MFNPYGNLYNGNYATLKTPEQYQSEMQQQFQQYQNAYNQMKNTMPNSPINQVIQNGGIFHYVDSFEEVEKAQVNMNGNAELFIGNNVLWSKKLINGQPYIDAFTFNRINNTGTPPQAAQETRKNESGVNVQLTTNDLYEAFMEEIQKINKRIDSIMPTKGEVVEDGNE